MQATGNPAAAMSSDPDCSFDAAMDQQVGLQAAKCTARQTQKHCWQHRQARDTSSTRSLLPCDVSPRLVEREKRYHHAPSANDKTAVNVDALTCGQSRFISAKTCQIGQGLLIVYARMARWLGKFLTESTGHRASHSSSATGAGQQSQ